MQSSPARQRLTAPDRRRQILEAAVRVFSRKGFAGAKTKDVASEAGINEALVFRHFATKDELYSAILDEVQGESWADAVSAATAEADSPEAFFRAYARSSLAWFRQRPDFMRLMLYSGLEGHELGKRFRDREITPIVELLAAYIRERQSDGAFRADIAPETAARVVFGAVGHQGLQKLLSKSADHDWMTDEQAAQAIAGIAVSGLVNRG
jgi:TetR/AcrR family transcriptional regulator